MNNVTQVVQIFLDIERPSKSWNKRLDLTEDWVKYRIDLFNKYTLPSLLNQTYQNFRIFLICGKKHKKMTSSFKWNKRVEVCYGKGQSGTITWAPGYAKPKLKVKEYLDIDTDYLAITRLDSDDCMHREAMANVRDSLILSDQMEMLIFRKYIYWDKVNGYVVPVHHKNSPPFITHIFPKSIYKDYSKFAPLHFVNHRFMGGKLDKTVELSEDRICVINHKENISRVKRGKELHVMTDSEVSGLKDKKKDAVFDQAKISDILKNYSIDHRPKGQAKESKITVTTSPSMEKTDIIFLTCNEHEMSIESLDSLQKYTHAPFRLIWIDNGSCVESHSEIRRRIGEFEDVVSHRFDVNRFYARGTNQGFILANSKYIVTMSNDVMVTDYWLTKMTSLMEKDRNIGLLSPLTDNIGNRGAKVELAVTRYRLPMNGNEYEQINSLPERYGNFAGDISMFCAMVRKSTIEKIGLLDERFFILGNDNDYCDRVRHAGYKTGVSLNCFVYHKHGATKNLIFPVDSPARKAIKKNHQALLKEKRRKRAMTGELK